MMGNSSDAISVQTVRHVERVLAELDKDKDELTAELARNRTEAIDQGLSNLHDAAEALRRVRQTLKNG